MNVFVTLRTIMMFDSTKAAIHCDSHCDSSSFFNRHAEKMPGIYERYNCFKILDGKCISFIISGHCKPFFCLICMTPVMTKCSDLYHFVKWTFYRLWIRNVIIALQHLKTPVNCLMLPACQYYIFHAIDLWMNHSFYDDTYLFNTLLCTWQSWVKLIYF